ncbi:insulinase family protein [Streptomyces sp. NPDC048340]|uniref:insulinase family protein n=1 Tax=Streptomyces sp. NPDC048340 TaxID=3365537 RepID=UPI003719DCFE
MTARRPGHALIVDLPRGHEDDAPHLRGLAALTARVLADPARPGAARLAAERGWRTRHQLDADRSSFAFWSADADTAEAATALTTHAGRWSAQDTDRLERAKAAQRALAAQRAGQILTRLNQASHRAAWGWAPPSPLGDPETIANLTPDVVRDELARLTRGARTHTPAAQPATAPPVPDRPHTTPDERTWQGGLAHAPTTAESARLSVRLPCESTRPGTLEVLVELLGSGPEGRLHRALRTERALAYGFSAGHWSQDSTNSVAATAFVRAPDAADTSRILLRTVRALLDDPLVPQEEFEAARHRCLARLLASLDDPFAEADEARRAARGQRPVADLVAAVRELPSLEGLRAAPGRPAVAVVGPEPCGPAVEEALRRNL